MTSQNKNLRLVFITAICFVFILSVFSYIKINSLIASAQLVNHTTQVTLELEKVIGSLKDAETGHRGYLLTHDKTFLEPANSALKEYPKSIETVRQLTVDNPAQQKSLSVVQQLAKHREDYMVKMLEVDKLRTPSAAELLIGKAIMDSLRTEVNTMTNRENSLMQQRSKKLHNATLVAPAMLFMLSLIALVLVIISYWQLNKSLLHAQQLKAEAIKQTAQFEKLKAKQESEKRFRDMVEQAPVAMCVLRGENYVVEVANEKQLELWGKTKEQVLNLPIFTAIPEGAGQGFEKLLNGVFTTGKPFIANELPTTLTRNGKNETFYTNFSYKPLYGSGNEIDGIVSVASDVTEQLIVRKKIEESEQRFQAAIAAVKGILWTNNAKGEMEGEQTGWASLTGQIYQEYQGFGWANAVHPDDAEPTVDAWNKAVKERSTFIFEHRVKTKDEGYKNFSIRAIPLLNPDGSLRQWVGVHTDITTEKQQQLILLEREEKFSTMADNISQFAWTADEKGWIYWYNKRWYDYTGTTLEEMQERGWQKVHHPDHLNRVVTRMQHSWDTGEVWEDTFPLRSKEGEYRWFLSRALPIRDAAGKVVRWFGTNTDITEQKNIQDLLKESEIRYRSLADNMPLMSFIIEPNPEATISYWNKTWLDYTAQTFNEALGRAWDGIIHPDDVQSVLDIYVPAFKNRRPYFIPAIRVKRYDGEFRWHFFKANPRYLPDGEFLGYVGIGFDIHEQKLTQGALEESEERFRSLVQTLPQLIWVTDERGNAEFASFRWKEYTGIEPRGEKEWKAIVHPDDYDNTNGEWVKSLQTGAVYKFDVRIKSKEGEYRWHTVAGEPVVDKENKIIKWVGAFTDIHTEKTFSHQLEEEVKQRTSELEEKNTQLENLNKELQTFAYISSHDLQEPLRKIQTFATRIVEKEYETLSENGKNNFIKMRDAAGRMQTLIQDLLAYSRTNTEERKFENSDLNKIVEEVKEDLSEELKIKNATIEATELCHADISPVLFRQLMQNLITNSLKFSNPQTRPYIKIKSKIAEGIEFGNEKLLPEKKYCHISVSDNGIGFEQQYSEKIFEVFQRLHGRSKFNGTGIGLSIVKKIVDNHNGIITATGETNKGATFDIYITAT